MVSSYNLYFSSQVVLRQKSNTPTSASSGGRTATPSTSSFNDATSNGPIPEVVTLQEFINYSSPVNNVCILTCSIFNNINQ